MSKLKIEKITTADCEEMIFHVNNIHMATLDYDVYNESGRIFIHLPIYSLPETGCPIVINGLVVDCIMETEQIIINWFAMLGIEIN